MENKKAAMFGLDARIALAIFGALSVISGAALYSAINEAKVVSHVTELNELSKAIESYMIDVGADLPIYAPGSKTRVLESLITSSEKGWAGPYIGLTPIPAAKYALFSSDGLRIYHLYHCKVTLAGDGCEECDDTAACGAFIKIDNPSPISLFYDYDDKIDITLNSACFVGLFK